MLSQFVRVCKWYGLGPGDVPWQAVSFHAMQSPVMSEVTLHQLGVMWASWSQGSYWVFWFYPKIGAPYIPLWKFVKYGKSVVAACDNEQRGWEMMMLGSTALREVGNCPRSASGKDFVKVSWTRCFMANSPHCGWLPQPTLSTPGLEADIALKSTPLSKSQDWSGSYNLRGKRCRELKLCWTPVLWLLIGC